MAQRPKPDPELALLRNENSTLTLLLQKVAQILYLPSNQSLRQLPAWAMKIMQSKMTK